MPIIYRNSLTWPGTAKQDGAFLLPESLPADESASVLVEMIFGPPYQQVIPVTDWCNHMNLHRKNHQIIEVAIVDKSGAPINCAGASLQWVVVDASSDIVINKAIGDGIKYIDASSGQAEITLTSDDTDIPSGSYKHELLLIDIDGHRYTVLTGTFEILISLTKDVI